MSKFADKPIGRIVKQLMKLNQDGKLVKQLQTELMEREDEYVDWCRKNPKFLEIIWR